MSRTGLTIRRPNELQVLDENPVTGDMKRRLATPGTPRLMLNNRNANTPGTPVPWKNLASKSDVQEKQSLKPIRLDEPTSAIETFGKADDHFKLPSPITRKEVVLEETKLTEVMMRLPREEMEYANRVDPLEGIEYLRDLNMPNNDDTVLEEVEQHIILHDNDLNDVEMEIFGGADDQLDPNFERPEDFEAPFVQLSDARSWEVKEEGEGDSGFPSDNEEENDEWMKGMTIDELFDYIQNINISEINPADIHF